MNAIDTKTLQRIFNIGYGSGKWLRSHGFFISVWLFFKGKAYRNRRLRILRNRALVVAKIRFMVTVMHPHPLLSKLINDGSVWGGSQIIIPLEYGKKENI